MATLLAWCASAGEVGRGPNGGYIAAMVRRALGLAVADPSRMPRALRLHFVAAPAPDACRIAVVVEREGRTLTDA